MRLFDLSLRFKLPLWGGGLIIATALALSASYVAQSWDNLNRDLLQNAEDIGRTTAHALFPVMLHDDVWDAFEVVSLPFTANPGTPMTESLIVLDSAKRVYVSSRPQEHPLLGPLAALGPDFAALDREIPMAPDAAIFVRDAAGAQRIYVALPIASDGVRLGTLIVSYNKSLLWERFSLILSRSLWISLLVLAVLLPITAYWGRRMMLPMRLVTERISRIGSGELEDLDPSLYPYGDEVGQLFKAYEAVLAKLREKAVFEKEMVKSERMAAVGRLTASIAHEINNPLGGMLNAISTLKRHGSPDPVTQKTISLLERGLSQIRETVAALLVEAKVKSRPLSASDLDDVRILVAPGGPQAGRATGLGGRPERHRGAAFDPGAPGAHQSAAQRHHRRRARRAGGFAARARRDRFEPGGRELRANPCCRSRWPACSNPSPAFRKAETDWVCGSATRSSPNWAVRSVPSRARSMTRFTVLIPLDTRE